MAMQVHISGDNPKFVDGERERFGEYADKKAVRVGKLSDADVLHVRLGSEGHKVKVSVDVDGDKRTDGVGTTAFSALDRAVDTLVNRLRKDNDRRTDRHADAPEPDDARNEGNES